MIEGSLHNNRNTGNIFSLLINAKTGSLLTVAGSFLLLHQKGVNVDDDLSAICEELVKREGIDFPGCRITGELLPNPFADGPDHALLFAASVISFLFVAFIVARGFSSLKRNAYT